MIRFNLKNIIEQYKQKYPKSHLTITSLSRLTGISRHALNTLCGKNGQPSGVQFATLDKLMDFFDIPVNKLILHKPNGLKITLEDATRIIPFDNEDSFFKAMTRRSVFISADVIGRPLRTELLALAHQLSKNDFIVSLGVNASDDLEQFESIFNGLTGRVKDYIYSRILAHSGMLTKRQDTNSLLITPILNEPLKRKRHSLKVVSGLPKRYILNGQPITKNKFDDSVVIDQTTNYFK